MGLVFEEESQQDLALRDPPPYGLTGYADSNFTRDSEDRKLIMGYCFFLNGVLIS